MKHERVNAIAVRNAPVEAMDVFAQPFGGMGMVKVRDEGSHVVVTAAIPGAEKRNTRIRVERGYVTFEMEQSRREEKRDRGFFYSASSYNSFTRSVPVPSGVRQKGWKTVFGKDGVSVRFRKE